MPLIYGTSTGWVLFPHQVDLAIERSLLAHLWNLCRRYVDILRVEAPSLAVRSASNFKFGSTSVLLGHVVEFGLFMISNFEAQWSPYYG